MAKHLFYSCLFLLTGIARQASAQKQADNWYFGNKAGICFSDGTPKATTDSGLSTEEGCAVISDAQGKLLFYTDGISVWNRHHRIMPNGRKLKGDPSSTQSGIAIPKPKANGTYYLFTVAATGGPQGICYSVVDMSRDSTWGDVDPNQKNQLLATPVTEKLTAVTHRNGKDTWVVAHRWGSDEFLAWLVTGKGVSTTAVSSKSGHVHNGNLLNSQGYMKASPDGSNLALAIEASDLFELFDFDNATGIVSQPVALRIPEKSYPYGVEFFVADGSILYGSAAATGQIYQFNLQAGSPEAIQASATVIGKTPDKKWIGALQLASNGKIYFPIYQTAFLGSIDHPEKQGVACQYQNNAVALAGRTTTLGLPTFTQSFFVQKFDRAQRPYFDPNKITLDQPFLLKNLQFELSKYNLQPIAYPDLQKIVALLKKHPGYQITINGHTDNIGNKSSNILLSLNRAKAVRDYLLAQQIDASRITFNGYGSSKPIADNETAVGRAKNRRVEFVLDK